MTTPTSDWYLREWLAAKGMTQTQLARLVNWQDSKVSRLKTGTSDWDRGDLLLVAAALAIEPFELLLHPREAEALQGLRASAHSIVAQTKRSWRDDAPPPVKAA